MPEAKAKPIPPIDPENPIIDRPSEHDLASMRAAFANGMQMGLLTDEPVVATPPAPPPPDVATPTS